MKQTTYATIVILAFVWIVGSMNSLELGQIGFGQAAGQIAAGAVVFAWSFLKGKLWVEYEE